MNLAVGMVLAVLVWLAVLLGVRALKPPHYPEAPPAVAVTVSGHGEAAPSGSEAVEPNGAEQVGRGVVRSR